MSLLAIHDLFNASTHLNTFKAECNCAMNFTHPLYNINLNYMCCQLTQNVGRPHNP